jgi:hypothetical protein
MGALQRSTRPQAKPSRRRNMFDSHVRQSLLRYVLFEVKWGC